MKALSIKTENDLALQKQKQVRISNVIVSGRLEHTQAQLDIFFYLLANLNKGEDTYIINCKDLELITGRKWNYQQFKAATIDMLSKVYEIEDEESYTQLVLFQYFKYEKGKGYIKVRLNELGLELCIDLKSNFTYLQLKSVMSMTSKYAKQIYALCCQWRSVGLKEYDLNEFKVMLGLIDPKTGNEKFKVITLFKNKILETVKDQINKHTDIQFDYKLEKKFYSRSFNSITIYINKPSIKQLSLELEQSDIDYNKTIKEQKEIKMIMSYGLSEQQAQTILSNGTINDFQDAIEEVKKTIVKQKVNNQIAYLCGILKNKNLL